ncbi:SAM-dependent methyltransferase [Actinoplanes sp. NPDC051851]|uniref:SAM-dependent methyltransferase n=1 Tax=Actinoplanes sp. NPDC051851 TaxID=3154753 RepID=UPI003420E0A7
MATEGIEAVYVETHNWGRSARFFQTLGFTLEFETDHNSGQLRNGDGPYVFIAEIPEEREPRTQIVLRAPDDLDLSDVEVVTPYEETHYGTREMTVRDPDGRLWIVQAPPEDRPVTPAETPDGTAVRTALWRALHVQVDAPPHVLEDEVGLRLARPGDGWRDRPDMDARFTSGFRASMVARARLVEDLVVEQAERGVTQYVILGAGLDTFAQRRPEIAARLQIFEIDQPGPQAWKRQRLIEVGYGVPEWLHLVPVDFETGEDWLKQLVAAGLDPDRPAVVVSTGVSMYLTRETTAATLRTIAGFAPGSTLAMTFMLPIDLVDEADRPGLTASANGARAAGTPFVSFYTPAEMLGLAREAGFTTAEHVPGRSFGARYFAGRPDGLRPSSGEDFLVATV